jgi:hypothetical protein
MTTPFAAHWTPAEARRLAAWQRVALSTVAVGLLGLLITAATLPPSEHGMGTHQQLGLPPCSFVMFLGVRCPACGMTTSWAHLMRGQLIQSAHANTGGLMLGVLAALGAPWMLASGLRGRWLFGAVSPEVMLWTLGTVFFITTLQWCWKVFA